MRKADVLAHFRNNQSAVARALGITRASVHNWPEIVPEGRAYQLEIVTGGRLKVDPRVYGKQGRVTPTPLASPQEPSDQVA